MGMQIRINKFISESGAASRRKAEEYINEGRVEVNGKLIMDLSTKIDPETDIVTIDGEKIKQKRHLYFLLNKPAGVVTTTNDEKGRKTVLDVVDVREKIYPVGRLDYNTTGVLLLTNDGDFTNMLTHPGNQVPKVYEVNLSRPLAAADKLKLLKGIYLESGKGKFTAINYPEDDVFSVVEVTSVEGRNHFIKDMFGALGYNVTRLNRKSFAGITADLPKGAYRVLKEEEVKKLFNRYGK